MKKKQKVKQTVPKQVTKPDKLTALSTKVDTFSKQVNELVAKTNSGLAKFCDVLDEHAAKIEHLSKVYATVQDGLKTVARELNTLKPKVQKETQTKKEGD